MMSTAVTLGQRRVPQGVLCCLLLSVWFASVHAESVTAPLAVPADNDGPAFTIHLSPGGWGQAQTQDIEKLLIAVARDIRVNFGKLPARVLLVEHGDRTPITLFKPGANSETVIQLACKDNQWAQFAYQFAHEICHVLANCEKKMDALGPNQWFEESLCETSSLYALRRMAVTWKKSPPYPNWSDYTKSLLSYADETMHKAGRQLPADTTLTAWFTEQHDHLRTNGVDRELNGLVANQFLPLFEQDPTRWDTVRFLNIGDDEHRSSFAAYLASWRDRVPEKHRAFIQTIMKLFGYEADVTVDAARAL